jgi:Zn-dependent protease with chaperone function
MLKIDRRVRTFESWARIFAIIGTLTSFFVYSLILAPLFVSSTVSSSELQKLNNVELVLAWAEWILMLWFFAIILGLAFFSPTLIARARGRKYATQLVTSGEIFTIVNRLSNLLALSRAPRILLEESEGVDCFVFGTFARNTRLLLSKDAVRMLSGEELEAVILHELSHIKNRDMGLATWGIYLKEVVKYWFGFSLIFAVVGAVLLTPTRGWDVWWSSFEGNVFFLISMVIIPILLVDSGLRDRELLADARVTLYPEFVPSLLSATDKINLSNYAIANRSSVAPTQELAINWRVQPSKVKRVLVRFDSFVAKLFRTAPSPIERRMAILDDEFVSSKGRIRLPRNGSYIYSGILGLYVWLGGLLFTGIPFLLLSNFGLSPFVVLVFQAWAFFLFFLLPGILFFMPSYQSLGDLDTKLLRKISNRQLRTHLWNLGKKHLVAFASFNVLAYVFVSSSLSVSWESLAFLAVSVAYLLISLVLILLHALWKLLILARNK